MNDSEDPGSYYIKKVITFTACKDIFIKTANHISDKKAIFIFS